MAYIPDEAALAMRGELSPAARDLFIYYCVRRNRKSGGFKCPVALVLAQMKGLKRSAYFEAKKELLEKDWIETKGDFIIPIRGFKSPDNRTFESATSPETRTLEKKQSPENRTSSPENRTQSPENRTAIYKVLPANIPATLIADSGPDDQSNETEGVDQTDAPEKPKSDHVLGMEFLWETAGPQSDAGGQAEALSWMLSHENTLEEIKYYFPIHMTEYDQKKYRPTYLTLKKVIGAMKRQNPMPKPSATDGTTDEYDNAILEIQRFDDQRFARQKDEAMNAGH